MKSAQIIATSIALCIAYGIVHDNITARLCIEYFTIGHRIVIPTDDPTLIALVWGVLATWWVGVFLGILIALMARFGRLPKLEPRELYKPFAILIGCAGICAAISGVAGYLAAVNHWVRLQPPLSLMVPAEKQVWFLVDLWIHNASYLAGFVGGIVLAIHSLRTRYLRAVTTTAGEFDRITGRPAS